MVGDPACDRTERTALTFWAFIVWDGHISVQGDSDNTALNGFELGTVQLHRKSMRQYEIVTNAVIRLRICVRV